MNTVYVGDTGTVITLDCGQDIREATASSIEVRKPDGTAVSWPAPVAADATSVAFVTEAATLDQAGVWRLQALVTLPSGRWRGKTAMLEVLEVFR